MIEGDLDLINLGTLPGWLDEHVPDLGHGPLEASLLAGGMSNAVFRVDRGNGPMVLRRPPRAPRPDSIKVNQREARVLAALNATPVPSPRLYAAGDDAVLGVPFYVMEFVDGFLGYGVERPPGFVGPDDPGHRHLPFALLDGIAALALVDYKAVGLEGFGRPDGFLDRQVDRWYGQLDSYDALAGYERRDIPGLGYAGDWLRANTPVTEHVGIIHGDYSLGNALFHWDPPARLAAMIDWELATIGDTMLDLGWVVYGFPGRDEKTPTAAYFDPAGYPWREELVAYYAERTGYAVTNLTYYMVLAQFKLATIMEGHIARAAANLQRNDDFTDDFVHRLAAKAGEMAKDAG